MIRLSFLAAASILLLNIAALPATVYHATFDSTDQWDGLGGIFTLEAGSLKAAGDSGAFGQTIRTAPVLQDFTLTLQARHASGAGYLIVAFCTQGNMAGYRLYVDVVRRSCTVYSVTGANSTKLLGSTATSWVTSSWINPDNNVIKISKSGSDYGLYFNGHLTAAFQDTTFRSGFVCFMAQPTANGFVEYIDDLVADDAPTAGAYDLSFSDDFNDGNLNGWMLPFAPDFSASGGKACGNNQAAGYIHFLANTGRYRNFTLDVDITRPDTATKLCGIVFRQQTDGSWPGYQLTIQLGGYRGCKLSKLGTAGSTLDSSFPQMFLKNDSNHVHIRAENDSIAVTINGQEMVGCRDNSFTEGGVGLMVVGPASFCFDNFNLVNIPVALEKVPLAAVSPVRLAAVPNPFHRSTVITVGGDLGSRDGLRLAIFDLKGRSVAVFSAAEIRAGQGRLAWSAAGLPSGIYVARLSAGRETHSLRVLLCK